MNFTVVRGQENIRRGMAFIANGLVANTIWILCLGRFDIMIMRRPSQKTWNGKDKK